MADSSVGVGSSDMHPQTLNCWHAAGLQRPWFGSRHIGLAALAAPVAQTKRRYGN
jgi:hypothetical protein